MKITNFGSYCEAPPYAYALVDVTTGVFWWRRRSTRWVWRVGTRRRWRFFADNKPTPPYQVEALESKYRRARELERSRQRLAGLIGVDRPGRVRYLEDGFE